MIKDNFGKVKRTDFARTHKIWNDYYFFEYYLYSGKTSYCINKENPDGTSTKIFGEILA